MFHTLTIRIFIVACCLYGLHTYTRAQECTPDSQKDKQDSVYVSKYDALIQYEDWTFEDFIQFAQWALSADNKITINEE